MKKRGLFSFYLYFKEPLVKLWRYK